jgi:uncharacterized damage-inducible protein DinB
MEDDEIRTRFNHMLNAQNMLMTLASGNPPNPETMKTTATSMDDLEAGMKKANEALAAAVESDLDRKIAVPRGPKGPFEATAETILLQALTHSQHHRGQNASRMRALGVTPPMTDFIFWYAQGRPSLPLIR